MQAKVRREALKNQGTWHTSLSWLDCLVETVESFLITSVDLWMWYLDYCLGIIVWKSKQKYKCEVLQKSDRNNKYLNLMWYVWESSN